MAGKRNTRTEAKIKAAFTTLVQSKGFDAMTVSDLARTAGINRGTFYMHYLDKFDLRQQLIDDTIEELTTILIDNADPEGRITSSATGRAICDAFQAESISAALRYVRDDYAFFNAVSRSGNDMQLYDKLKKVLKQLIVAQAKRFGADPQASYNGIPADYAMEILVSAVSSIIWLWIRRGCKETPEEICRIIEINKTTAPIDVLW
ncbi:TetR/AcrR family transcriptional regulator C-terminal domain-containing protein [Bifidobacterium sp. MA2]|uniref:TetR/AcrR family transcriptional regulator C-terminal domain-containing protein n=2 Tax=Bifidobacterium santillanense TaxID=2809028 RepID=A0ABS5ULT6_9BIFI|nr:TetR/AcrR family transcriptional regulator C-terminal domain-containing protein [Bifidobacterium santillanense]